MSRKKTIEEVRFFMASIGYELLTDHYIDAHSMLNVRCSKGHEFSSNFNRISSDNKRCNICNAEEREKKKLEKQKIKAVADVIHKFVVSIENEKRKTHKKNGRNIANIKKIIEGRNKFLQNCEIEKYQVLSDYIDSQTKVDLLCPLGHEWSVIPASFNTGRRCKECSYKIHRSGYNHPNYNFDLTDEERENKRKTAEDHQWRLAIYRKCGYNCQKCGFNGKSKDNVIEAHHIFNYAEYPELRLDIDNGICLCAKCHLNYHKQYGFRHNTLSQLEEFLLN